MPSVAITVLRRARVAASFGRLVTGVAWAIVFLPLPTQAQTATRPDDPGAANPLLEVGPVAGLTTAWHPAPSTTGIPLGTTVRLRFSVPQGVTAVWSGAREIERRGRWSVAERRFDAPGLSSVSASYDDPEGVQVTARLVFEVIDILLHPITVVAIHMHADPLVIDDQHPNASTMAYYFQDSSIAALRKVGEGRYRTSTNRWLRLEAEIQPAAFLPLVEWRLDGRLQRHIGVIKMRLFTTGFHSISAGPSEKPATVQLETYGVRITTPALRERIRGGVPVTFTAVTDPLGYETEITWLASTKYGGCSPMMGSGGEFTTTFERTAGPEGVWLGVKADNDRLGQDLKNVLCTQLQQQAAQLLATHPAEQEILLLQPPLQEFIFQGLDTLQRAAAGEICTDEEILQFVRQSEGRRTGFSASVSLICPGELTEFRDCEGDCTLAYFNCGAELCGGFPGLREPCLELGTCGLALDYCEHRCIVSKIPKLIPVPPP